MSQQIACYDSCQLTIAWIPKNQRYIYGIGAALVTYLLRYWLTDRHVYGRMYGQSSDSQNCLDRWVTKLFKVWGSAYALLARRSSANKVGHRACYRIMQLNCMLPVQSLKSLNRVFLSVSCVLFSQSSNFCFRKQSFCSSLSVKKSAVCCWYGRKVTFLAPPLGSP